MGKTIPENVKKAFFDMLHLDVLRGDDSTGVAAISNIDNDKTEVEVFKSLGGPSEFFYEHCPNKKFRSITTKPVNIYIGHNRYATQGKISQENAHPFEFDNVVGAHNGTVAMSSLRDFHGYKDFDIDSQIIYSHLSHTRDVKKVWKDADGALALTWYDKIDKRLRIIRNKERPLFFAYSKNDEQVFWASEKWMIFIAAHRQNVDILDPVELKPNVLCTFGIDALNKVFHNEEEIPPFVPKPVHIHYPSSHLGYRNYYDNWLDDYDENGSSYHGKQNDFTGWKKPQKKPNGGICVLTEFHDIPNNPAAVGYLPSGKLVKINIPIFKYQDARKKLLENKEEGFFSIKKLNQSISDRDAFWCVWDDCTFIKLKPHMQIIRKPDNTFAFHEKDKVKFEYAPWYNKKIFLNLSAYVAKTKCGCFGCHEVPFWGQRDQLHWIKEDMFFCRDCQSLDYVKELINKEA